jgi:hypothetical protein
MWRLRLTIEFEDTLRGYIETQYGEFEGFVELKDWLTEDIVKVIQLMDAELQRRYDEECAIRNDDMQQLSLFNIGDDDEEDEDDYDPPYWADDELRG